MSKKDTPDYIFKLLCLGETGVGKTCVILRYSDNKYTVQLSSEVIMMTDSATGIKYTSYTQPTVRFVSLSQHDIICTSQYSMMSPNAIIGEEDNRVEETSGE